MGELKDPEGDNLFGGGFLGMDNVGPFDRSAPLPEGLVLEQADGTGWMALYCLSMLEIAIVLAAQDRAYEDVAIKFFEHFALIADGDQRSRPVGRGRRLLLRPCAPRPPTATAWPVRVRSMTGLIPFCAVAVGDPRRSRGLPEFGARIREFLELRPE